MSVPFGTWFGVRVRLHFWMLLALLFAAVDQSKFGAVSLVPALLALILAGVLVHEFGRRISTQLVGGRHDDFMLWPAGGIIHPSYTDRPMPMFVSHIGGVIANFVLGTICWIVLMQGGYPIKWLSLLNPLMAFMGMSGNVVSLDWPSMVLCFLLSNIGVMWASLLPYYWFDGGHLLQSVLWPWTGRRRAIIVTGITGMVLGAMMFLYSLSGPSFMGMIMWALLFASAYTRWQQARFENDYETEGGVAWASSLGSEAVPRRRKPGRLSTWLTRRKVAKEQQDQAAVDRILEKVAQHGMHSLSGSEKRTLARASERLRDERRM